MSSCPKTYNNIGLGKPKNAMTHKQRAQRKKPEFFRCPKTMLDGRSGKAAEERASKYPGGRNQENRNDLL